MATKQVWVDKMLILKSKFNSNQLLFQKLTLENGKLFWGNILPEIVQQ